MVGIQFKQALLRRRPLIREIRYITGKELGQSVCPECGIIVARKSALKTHIQEVHQGIRDPCDQCLHQARNKKTLK